MADGIAVRESLAGDASAIESLYLQAFPDEDLLPLINDLLSGRPDVLSLVAADQDGLAGHVACTRCTVPGVNGSTALLGPLAVSPGQQRRGIGTLLVSDGLKRLKAEGVMQAFVLGDPAYYGRFGFLPESRIAAPYDLPEEWRAAWQSLRLDEGAPSFAGRLLVPEPWQDQALWQL